MLEVRCQALDYINASNRKPITNAHIISGSSPVTFTGESFQFQRKYFRAPTIDGNSVRYSVFVLRVDKAGYYAVEVNTSNSRAGGELAAWMDGKSIGKVINVPAATQATVVDTVYLSVALHGLRVIALKNADGGNQAAKIAIGFYRN